MNPQTETQDIALLIEQARRHRGTTNGRVIVDRCKRVVTWLLRHADKLLHRLLMSPVPTTNILKEN